MFSEVTLKTIQNIKEENIPIIIFGAGLAGEALFYACSSLEIKVECFCDNNINKTKTSLCNIEVIHTQNLKTKYKDAIFFISALDIKAVVEQLNVLGYSKWYPISLLLRDFDLFQYQFSTLLYFVEEAIDACLLYHENFLTPDKLFLSNIDIIITERCSLKCKDCSNLMQYYKKPIDCSTKELLESIDVLCNIIDKINEVRVIGGEPFINNEFHLITKRLIDEPKIKKIVIYTNGTIIPKEDKIEILKNKKILIFITDYGKFSKKLEGLAQKLQLNNIAFYTLKAQGWTDCSEIKSHYRNTEQQEEIFKNCCAKNLVTFSNGKLFRCPFSANTHRLQAVPDYIDDYINLIQKPIETIDIYEMKTKIKNFLLGGKNLQVCDYCNGRTIGSSEIEPAIQTNKPLIYKQVQFKTFNR